MINTKLRLPFGNMKATHTLQKINLHPWHVWDRTFDAVHPVAGPYRTRAIQFFTTGIGALWVADHILKGLSTMISTPFATPLTIGLALYLNWKLLSNHKSYTERKIKNIIQQSQQQTDRRALFIETAEIQSLHSLPLPLRILRPNLRELKTMAMLGARARTHAITWIIVRDKDQLQKSLDELNPNAFDIVQIKGHGDEFGIDLNDREDLDMETITCPDHQQLLRSFSRIIKNRAHIILLSCSTGYGEDNFARTLSELLPNATIHAPCSDVTDVSISANPVPRFYDGSRPVPVRSYPPASFGLGHRIDWTRPQNL